ncbi:PIR protein, putative [Plasmodium sp.]|nr:PIR protein, putative [Plasmodium sp.]
MKVHYINMLLFALPLDILVSFPQTNSCITSYTPTTRSLCECELYTSIYDNDPEMKTVMKDFDRQTSQRFEEYNERMTKNRQKCKDQCDKDIQKIILKDKIEKELKQQLTTLETNIDTNDIPTCFCEKSTADKVEKSCLKCGRNLGVAVPGLGVLGAYGVHSIVKVAMTAAEKVGIQLGIDAGNAAGVAEAISGVISKFNLPTLGGVALENVIKVENFKKNMFIVTKILEEYDIMCVSTNAHESSLLCSYSTMIKPGVNPITAIATNANSVALKAGEVATSKTAEVTPGFIAEEVGKVVNAGAILSNPIKTKNEEKTQIYKIIKGIDILRLLLAK